MGDLATYRQWRTLQGLRAVERDQALDALQAANAAEREASAGQALAEDALSGAVDAWQACLTGNRFDPDFARTLGQVVATRSIAVDRATDALRQAQTGKAGCEAAWMQRDALSRQSDTLVARARRRLLLAREARSLDAVADRTTYRWRQR